MAGGNLSSIDSEIFSDTASSTVAPSLTAFEISLVVAFLAVSFKASVFSLSENFLVGLLSSTFSGSSFCTGTESFLTTSTCTLAAVFAPFAPCKSAMTSLIALSAIIT